MDRIIGLIVGTIGAVSLSACAAEANKTYQAPIAGVHDKLADLDTTKNIGSAASKAPSDVTMNTDAPDSVTWYINGKGGAKIFDVIAHLTAKGDNETRVAIEIVKGDAPDPLPEALGGMRANMMMERIASHLEDRRFNDKPFLDMQYAMVSPLVPKEMVENARAARESVAQAEGDMAEAREKIDAERETAQREIESRQAVRDAGKPAVDLSQYHH